MYRHQQPARRKLVVDVTGTLYETVDQAAKPRGITTAEFVQKAIEHYLKTDVPAERRYQAPRQGDTLVAEAGDDNGD
jgi:metal-responsive CopG/Arc/MetJ family transcriptional regulator